VTIEGSRCDEGAMTDQEQIDELLDNWLASRSTGQETSADQLCRNYPHLRVELERQIQAIRAIDALRLPGDPNATAVAQALQGIERGTAVAPGSRADALRTPFPSESPRPRRGWLVVLVAIIAVIVPLAAGGVALVAVLSLALKPVDVAQQIEKAKIEAGQRPELVAALPPKLEPLKGSIDVLVSKTKTGPSRRLNHPDHLPVKRTELIRIDARLNRPAYMYVVWIDSKGKATPMYPWLDEDWAKREPEKPREVWGFPQGADQFAPLDEGPQGVECMVLMCRDTPLPESVDLKAIFANLPSHNGTDVKVSAWFENGELVRNDQDRGPIRLDKAILSENPVLRTQALLRTKLKAIFPYTRAACFGCEGDK
jgi:hypothetical protein